MPKTCIVTKENRRITSVRTFTGLRSKLYDKIASIPVMGNRDQAFSFFEKVYSKKFMDKFGDWTEESRIPAAMRELREEMDRQYEEGAVKLQYYTGEETGEILPRLIGEEGVRNAFNFALSPANQSPAYANERMEMVRGLYIARMAENEGVPMRKIYRATGWQKDADGKWKYELPDNIELSESLLRILSSQRGGTGELKFKDLFKPGNSYLQDIVKEYPSLLNATVKLSRKGRGSARGSFSELSESFEFNLSLLSKDTFVLTLIHEVQHFIQKQEGFGRGGSSTAYYIDEYVPRVRSEIYRDLRKLRDERNKILSTSQFSEYQEAYKRYDAIREQMQDVDYVYTKTFQEYIKKTNKLYSEIEEINRRINSISNNPGRDPALKDRVPREFSGGQRQRLGIARALASNPDLIVCDEPISALDVSIQAQIINLLEDLQVKLGITYLFIAHDLSVVKHISDRIIVMYLGKIVEIAGCEDLYDKPMHPYTQALLSAVPIADPLVEEKRERIHLQGEVPSVMNRPSGCPFCNRCAYSQPECSKAVPELEDKGNGHHVACFYCLDK